MLVNELLAIAKQNELRERTEHARLVRQARGDRSEILIRGLNAAREQIRKLTAPSAKPADPEGATRMRRTVGPDGTTSTISLSRYAPR